MRDLKVLPLMLLVALLLASGVFPTPGLYQPTRAQQKGRKVPVKKPADRQLVRPSSGEPAAKTGPGSVPSVTVGKATTDQRRIALVIGNSAYTKAPLQNPVNDAQLIEGTLRELGFAVIRRENLSLPTMREAVRTFGQQLAVGGIGLFYYAGHGVQVNGRNYLVPVDFGRVASLQDAENELLNAEAVLKTMTAKQGLNIMILDACRDNGIKLGFTPVDKPGFAEIRNTPGGTFIAYSTSPGDTASDGEGEHSPYSEALARGLRMRPSRLEDVFIHTRIMMEERTNGKQVPWEHTSIKTAFYFSPDTLSAGAAPNLAYQGPLRGQLLKGLLGGLRQANFNVMVIDADGEVESQLAGRASFFVEDESKVRELEMVEIPGGRFQMGTNGADADAAYADARRYDSEENKEVVTVEMPQHSVDVKGFFMSRYEITQRQWRDVMGGLPPMDEKYRGDDLPVVNVSYRDAEQFCEALSNKTGRLYRLPSEAEWEYACRAGSTTPFAFGPTLSPRAANYNSNAPFGNAEARNSRKAMLPVRQSGSANAFGLYGMHGNVLEWCADNWHDSYDGAPTDGKAWKAPNDDTRSYRVIRGGSWDSTANSCRSASRRKSGITTGTKKLGFRVVVS